MTVTSLQVSPYQTRQPFRSAEGLPIGTVIDDSFPQAASSLAGRWNPVLRQADLQHAYRYGVGGPESQPGQNGIEPPPSTAMPPSPEQSQANVRSDMNLLLDYLREREERQDDPEVLKRRTDEALRLMNAIGDKQMELGWKSNLIGFGLKELPRLMTEPGRRRNRYLDDLVLNTPGIQARAASALTGQAIPNYAMGI